MMKYKQIQYSLILLLLFCLLTGCGQSAPPLAEAAAIQPVPEAYPLAEALATPLQDAPAAAAATPVFPSLAESTQPAALALASDQLTAKEGQYTIAWLSDTQHYSSSNPSVFLAMTKFLFKQRLRMKLGYVVHTGDIVSSAGSVQQWQNAVAAMQELRGIPYGVLAGNHDVGSKKGYAAYSKYFGMVQFSGRAYYGGSFQDNRNHYDLITLGSTDFIFVYLGYQPTNEGIAWANDVFSSYPNRVGVLCSHKYLDSNSNLNSTGKQLQAEVVATNPNIRLVLCGHRYTEDCIPQEFDDDGDGIADRVVYQCIANYQNTTGGGNGNIRFIQIDEQAGMLQFITYSPYTEAYKTAPEGAKNPGPYFPIPW